MDSTSKINCAPNLHLQSTIYFLAATDVFGGACELLLHKCTFELVEKLTACFGESILFELWAAGMLRVRMVFQHLNTFVRMIVERWLASQKKKCEIISWDAT